MKTRRRSPAKDPEIKSVSELAEDKRKRFFPFKMKNGFAVEAVSPQEYYAFVEKHLAKMFPLNPNNYTIKKKSKVAKALTACFAEYAKIHHEYFLIRHKGKTIGWSSGEMEDFETFYMRNSAILPNFQMRGVYSEFLKHFLKYIESLGYQKVTSQHNPQNQAILNTKLRQGFIIVGAESHDRWGYLVKTAKFFHKPREKAFQKRFL